MDIPRTFTPAYKHPEYWGFALFLVGSDTIGMSLSETAAGTADRTDPSVETTVIEAEDTIHSLLNALHTADCRAILDATSDHALSANEIATQCDLPLSSVYRKLALLTEAGLLDERTRVRRSGHHTSEYVRVGSDVVVSVAADGTIALAIHRPVSEQPPSAVADATDGSGHGA